MIQVRSKITVISGIGISANGDTMVGIPIGAAKIILVDRIGEDASNSITVGGPVSLNRGIRNDLVAGGFDLAAIFDSKIFLDL